MTKKRLFALVGKDIAYSKSPSIHNEIFEKTGRGDCCYNIVDIPDSAALYLFYKRQMEDRTYCGINVTIPYKIEIMPYLDSLEENARTIGSVNTVLFYEQDGRFLSKGYNTDYTGFIRSLDNYGVDVQEKSAAILGTGGVSRAVSKALCDLGIEKIDFVSTSKARYSALSIMTYREFTSKERFYDIIVNCTPKGIVALQLWPSFSGGRIKTDVFYDLNYFASPDNFMLSAESLGIKVIDGHYMLKAQALCAHDIWFNEKKGDAV